jgi:oxaloacetate decarboxylase beta subunit
MCAVTRGKVNPLIGAAGTSAFPMAARVVQVEGQRYNRRNYLLMHAMGANTGGQLGSVMAAGIMLSVLAGVGIG